MPVLITAASHAEAFKLERLLQNPDIIFADHQDISHLKYSGKNCIQIPAGNSPSYAHQILSLSLDLGLDKIYPLYFNEVKALAEAKLLFAEYGIVLMVPDKDFFTDFKETDLSTEGELIIIENGKIFPEKSSVTLPATTGIFIHKNEESSGTPKLFAINESKIQGSRSE